MIVQHLRILVPGDLTEAVLGVLIDDPAVSGVAVSRGASLKPVGDMIFADIAREATNDVVDRLRALRVHKVGSIHLVPVQTWLSEEAYRNEREAPGSGADAVIWADVTQRAYEDSELNWTYVSFLTMATMIASIAIITDSQILVIGAMVLGPEFGAIAALGVAIVRRRPRLLWLAARTLVFGFLVAIAAVTVLAAVGRRRGPDRPGSNHGAAGGNCLHLPAQRLVLDRGRDRRGRGGLVVDLLQGRGPVRGVHLRYDGAGRRQHRARHRHRRLGGGIGEHPAVVDQPGRDGGSRCFGAGPAAGGVVTRVRLPSSTGRAPSPAPTRRPHNDDPTEGPGPSVSVVARLGRFDRPGKAQHNASPVAGHPPPAVGQIHLTRAVQTRHRTSGTSTNKVRPLLQERQVTLHQKPSRVAPSAPMQNASARGRCKDASTAGAVHRPLCGTHASRPTGGHSRDSRQRHDCGQGRRHHAVDGEGHHADPVRGDRIEPIED